MLGVFDAAADSAADLTVRADGLEHRIVELGVRPGGPRQPGIGDQVPAAGVGSDGPRRYAQRVSGGDDGLVTVETHERRSPPVVGHLGAVVGQLADGVPVQARKDAVAVAVAGGDLCAVGAQVVGGDGCRAP
ncbi:hypothetical protein [Phytohabitans kaempferiae]|uniref:Uncharacterized protein n=1 Tax=Phytohabitans kaempferiae TaxID=1620943 RepID=A0ABV6MA90_9ACTN